MTQRTLTLALGVGLFVCLPGCSTIQRETHYLKSVDAFGYPINYYRVEVAGSTALSSARYLSGYFPESVVDIYFGQIPQPTNGQFGSTQPVATSNATEAAAKVSTSETKAPTTEVVGAPKDTKLVLLLSSRADAVSQEISDIARSEDLMRNITAIAYRDRLREAHAASRAQTVATTRLDALAQVAENSIGTLTGTGTPSSVEEAKLNALMFVNQVAFYFGNKTPFKSLDEAGIWYEQNRDSLVGR